MCPDLGGEARAHGLPLAALLVGTHWPNLRMQPVAAWAPLAPDKVLHAAGYGGLALLIVLARPLGLRGRGLLGLAAALVLLLGAGTELTQSLVPGRTFSWLDAAASIGGGAAVLGILCLLGKLRGKSRAGG